jgi:hypothetical protein
MAPCRALLLAAATATLAAAQGGPWDARLFLHSDATATALNAACLDGSKGGFYYRPAFSPAARNKWKLHFMGGGWAFTPEELLSRSRGLTGSSRTWQPWLGTFFGFFGLDSLNDTSVNIVGDYNFVWFAVRFCGPPLRLSRLSSQRTPARPHPPRATPTPPPPQYCDGTSQTSDLVAPLVVNGTALHLRGRALLDAHLLELDFSFNFTASATEVIVGGTSAGGLSVHLHAPLLAARLPRARVVAVPDAGWWWDTPSFASPAERPWLDAMTPAVALWNASFNPANPAAAACAAANAAAPARCLTQPYQAAFSTVPTFHAQSLYDSAGLSYCYHMPCRLAGRDAGSCNAEQVAGIQAYAARVRASIEGASREGDGWFLQGCSQHETSCRALDWFGVATPNGKTMNSTFAEWWSGAGPGREVDAAWPLDASCAAASFDHGFC